MRVTHRITFERMVERRTFYWVLADGKRRQITRVFEQTVNPWNKNPDGTVKSRDQVRASVRAEADAWLKEKQSLRDGGSLQDGESLQDSGPSQRPPVSA